MTVYRLNVRFYNTIHLLSIVMFVLLLLMGSILLCTDVKTRDHWCGLLPFIQHEYLEVCLLHSFNFNKDISFLITSDCHWWDTVFSPNWNFNVWWLLWGHSIEGSLPLDQSSDDMFLVGNWQNQNKFSFTII